MMDGRIKIVEERWQMFFGEGGADHAVGTCHDITERKRAEEAVRERAESHLRFVLDTHSRNDPHGSSLDGWYLDWISINAGWNTWDFRCARICQGWHFADRSLMDILTILEGLMQDRWCASLASGAPFQSETVREDFEVRREDGIYRWMLDST